MPESIAALLQLVRILLTHGRRLVATVNAKGDTPQFASIGVTFGTHNLPVVLARIQRGILRLLALEAYLCQRTQKGREIPFAGARIPSFCTGEMGNTLLQVLEYYGGSLAKLFAIRRKREIAFQGERDKRPETWEWNWRDLRKDRMRQVLGYLIGEQPPDAPLVVPA